MKVKTVGLICILSSLTGCAANYTGIRLIDPPTPGSGPYLKNTFSVENFGQPGDSLAIVKELQPTFRWEDKGPGVTYDIAIWDAVWSPPEQKKTSLTKAILFGNPSTKPGYFSVGSKIYFREGLQSPSHKLEETLLPGKRYFWSVKLSTSENWSTYNYIYRGLQIRNYMALFQTSFGD